MTELRALREASGSHRAKHCALRPQSGRARPAMAHLATLVCIDRPLPATGCPFARGGGHADGGGPLWPRHGPIVRRHARHRPHGHSPRSASGARASFLGRRLLREQIDSLREPRAASRFGHWVLLVHVLPQQKLHLELARAQRLQLLLGHFEGRAQAAIAESIVLRGYQQHATAILHEVVHRLHVLGAIVRVDGHQAAAVHRRVERDQRLRLRHAEGEEVAVDQDHRLWRLLAGGMDGRIPLEQRGARLELLGIDLRRQRDGYGAS
mmetsp:Transcript_43750/g.112951  ORF Transcript_43750/g.112951 Transcript_43750/m.112951 type:complete len:266 (-) Transcript_43750:535-1332(-)